MFNEDKKYADSHQTNVTKESMETELAQMEMSTMEDDIFFDVDMDQ